MIDYYNREGKEIDLDTWEKFLSDTNYKIIKQENVGKYWVSTVWLGLNHQYGEGEPLIFETMVFKGKESDLDCERYTTEEEAIKGHQKMVKKYLSLTK